MLGPNARSSCLLRPICFRFFARRPSRPLHTCWMVLDRLDRPPKRRPMKQALKRRKLYTDMMAKIRTLQASRPILRSKGWISSFFTDGKGPMQTWWPSKVSLFGPPQCKATDTLQDRPGTLRRLGYASKLWPSWTSWPSWCILDHYEPLSIINQPSSTIVNHLWQMINGK